MIVGMNLGYLALVYVTFKLMRIKANLVSVTAAVLAGVILIGGTVIGSQFSAPVTGQMTVKRDVIPLISGQDSKNFITKIHVEQDQMVKKGDVLYEVDATPNQAAVDGLTAQLAVSRETISELEAGVEVATAAVESVEANRDYAKAQLDTAIAIQQDNPAAIAKLKVTVQTEKYASSQAAVDQAIATEKEARFALISAKETLKGIEAELGTAELNLEQCKIIAPADGSIMNWQAVEGTMTVTVITRPQGLFMDMTETVVAAVFPQNLLKNVEAEDAVEIAFKSMPGRIVMGKVDEVLEYTGEGQLEPSAELPVVANLGSKGFLVVRIHLDDEELAKELPLGGAGSVAIYTKTGRPFHVISKITIRLNALMNYTPL
jgi:multidrug resistance efflux pump